MDKNLTCITKFRMPLEEGGYWGLEERLRSIENGCPFGTKILNGKSKHSFPVIRTIYMT